MQNSVELIMRKSYSGKEEDKNQSLRGLIFVIGFHSKQEIKKALAISEFYKRGNNRKWI